MYVCGGGWVEDFAQLYTFSMYIKWAPPVFAVQHFLCVYVGCAQGPTGSVFTPNSQVQLHPRQHKGHASELSSMCGGRTK